MKLSVKDFNHIVNNSENLENKYNQWASYRENVKQLIERGAALVPEASEVMVLGAGACNDIDLKFLLQRFDRIFLTDVDIRTMKEGIKRQNINIAETEKIQLIEAEYTGLEKINFFQSFSEKIFKGLPIEEICSYIEETFEKFSVEDVLKEYRGRFEIVLSAPVYTQLAVTQFMVTLQNAQRTGLYSSRELTAVYERLYKFLPRILFSYNDLLLSLCKNDGILVSWIDMIETDTESSLMKSVKEYMGNRDMLNKSVEEYLKQMGKGMAEIGRENLLQRTISEFYKWMVWPFSSYRNILVYGYLGRKA